MPILDVEMAPLFRHTLCRICYCSNSTNKQSWGLSLRSNDENVPWLIQTLAMPKFLMDPVPQSGKANLLVIMVKSYFLRSRIHK